MAKIENPYRCDGQACHNTKQPSNGWYILMPKDLSFETQFTSDEGEISTSVVSLTGSYIIVPWDDKLAKATGVKHLCGVDCVLKEIGKILVSK